MKNIEIQSLNEAMSIDENRINSWNFPIHDKNDFFYLIPLPAEKRYEPKDVWRERIIAHELAYGILERGKEISLPDFRVIFRNLLEVNKNWHKEHPGVTLDIETEFDNLIDAIGNENLPAQLLRKTGVTEDIINETRNFVIPYLTLDHPDLLHDEFDFRLDRYCKSQK